MGATWLVLKPRLVGALVSAFDEDDFAQMLDFKCERKLDHLVAAKLKFPQKVYEVVGDAERKGWLDRLASSAREVNQLHVGLQVVTGELLTGIDAHGNLFYQESVIATAAGVPEETKLWTRVSAHIGDSVTPVAAGELEKLVRRQIPKLNAREMRQQMMRVEGQMCVVERLRDDGQGEARGSGFLIGPDVVLTNYHVVEGFLDGSQAQRLQVRFDALLQERGVREPEEGLTVAVDAIPVARPFTPGDPGNVRKAPAADELDFALLLLAKDAGSAPVGGEAGPHQSKMVRGWITIPDTDPVFEVGDPLIIYQYPGGRELMLAIDTEAVLGTVWDGRRLRYRNNTEKGSSGSPVFNLAWELVALHHIGGPGPEPASYNQGIPAARIEAYLQAQQFTHLLGG